MPRELEIERRGGLDVRCDGPANDDVRGRTGGRTGRLLDPCRMLRSERKPEPRIDESGVGGRHEHVVTVPAAVDPVLGRGGVQIPNDLWLANGVPRQFDPDVGAPALVAMGSEK